MRVVGLRGSDGFVDVRDCLKDAETTVVYLGRAESEVRRGGVSGGWMDGRKMELMMGSVERRTTGDGRGRARVAAGGGLRWGEGG